MTFGEIFEFAKKGQKVRRKNWKNEEFYVYLSKYDTYFLNRFTVNTFLKPEDYAADDWEIYEKREYFDFWKALELMESGEKVRSKAWGDVIVGYLYLSNNNEFCIEWDESEEKRRYYYSLKRRDLKAKDWYIVEEEE